MKNLTPYTLFESKSGLDTDNYVGTHCGPMVQHGDYEGKITDEYHGLYELVLRAIQHDYDGAKAYIEQIQSLEDGLSLEDDDAIELIFDIESFFADNNIEWIFVSKGEALTKYGEHCYYVYFDDMNDVYSIQDELVDNAMIYIYDAAKIKPRLEDAY